ncbi:DUF4115 domain-containing protein [Marinobacter sp. 71-i]|uniref:DUF4115 domain-containing protein n=1 Tax=Marinobacter iranensis TaxID=2962607 RepID=A0ABT5YAD6_9GAMM|nr:RodZ domain-containing protein [Marinobacter iranensis]MDF0750645.1 DUF4115 domain-containing protein [Marinobacter iranensis]
MDSDDTLQQPAVSEPAGQQLKRAREQKGLSVTAVAEAQHLRPAVIQAIEDGEYEQIDSELFLKGYVRTYARQVDLDPDAIIATLDQELEPLRQQKVEAEEANPLVDIERRRRQKRRIARLLLFLLAIAVIVFLGLRFMGELDGTVEDTAEPDVATEAESPEQGDEADPLDNGTDETVTESQPEPVVEEPIIEENGELTSTPPEVVPPEAPEQAEAPAPDVEEVDESRVPVVTSSPEPTFQESAQPEAAVGTGRLEMTFTDKCWVQVTDSVGNRLVGSLQREGDQIDVSGRLPIDVVVGAVDAIESIRFDGEPVDLAGFRVVNNRAEFTLDI